jgi:hypothetical protein
MVDLKESRHILSKKLDIAAEDLDESIIPILISVDKISVGLTQLSIEIERKLLIIEQNSNKLIPSIYCDKPKTALLVGIGKFGSISLAVSIFLSVFWSGLVLLKTQEKKHERFENLSMVIKYKTKTGGYFVERKNYKVLKGGILINGK